MIGTIVLSMVISSVIGQYGTNYPRYQGSVYSQPKRYQSTDYSGTATDYATEAEKNGFHYDELHAYEKALFTSGFSMSLFTNKAGVMRCWNHRKSDQTLLCVYYEPTGQFT